MTKKTIPLEHVDLINNKLQQAKTIALLIGGNNSSEAPLNDECIGFALSAIYDLISDSYNALNKGEKNVNSK